MSSDSLLAIASVRGANSRSRGSQSGLVRPAASLVSLWLMQVVIGFAFQPGVVQVIGRSRKKCRTLIRQGLASRRIPKTSAAVHRKARAVNVVDSSEGDSGTDDRLLSSVVCCQGGCGLRLATI